MKPSVQRQPGERLLLFLLWAFALSFAFDFRADVDGGTGGSAAQYLFLMIALGSGSAIVFNGHRHLLQKPGVYLLMIWWGYLAYAFIVANANGVPLGRFVRVIIPFALLGLAMAVAHVAACSRLKPWQIVFPVVVAATTNIVWRVFYGFAFKGVTLSTVRIEILSPGINWAFAYIGVALLLAPRFRKSTLPIAIAAFGCTFLSVTRGLILPMVASAITCWICLLIGLKWRVFSTASVPRRLLPIGGMIAVIGSAVIAFSLAQPAMLERWVGRIFDQSNGQSAVDPSLLTRQAEAVAMFDILKREPIHFIYGKGVGGAYYWDDSFYEELWEVYPDDFDFSGEFWFAGHSVWTWATFSGGFVGAALFVALFVGVMVLSLACVRRNAAYPGGSIYLGFLPFVAAWCILSESLTSNPFDERLAGLIFGLMAGLPQALFVRARDHAAQQPHLQTAPQPHAGGFQPYPAHATPRS